MANEPRLTPAKRAELAAREQRLAQALRDNLRRRKEQARGKTSGEAQETRSEPDPRKPPP